MSGDISNIQHMVSRTQAAEQVQHANKENIAVDQKQLENEHVKKVIDEKEKIQDTQKSEEDVKIKDGQGKNAGSEKERQHQKKKDQEKDLEENDNDGHIVDIKV